jgi:CRISPR/Cas system-associated exonuclease Cas4 (RecB family)
VKKGYVWLSEIFAYAEYPMKFKLKYVDKIDIPLTREMVFGSLSHKLREALTKKDNKILHGVRRKYGASDIGNEYMSYYDEISLNAKVEHARDLGKIGVEEQEALDFIVQDFMLKIRVKAVRVCPTMNAIGIKGENLAEYITPSWRHVEYKITDKELTIACVVDWIERHAGTTFYLVETKTGKPSAEDVFWLQKIQTSNHAMFIESHLATRVSFGFIENTQVAEKRPVMATSEMRKKVETLRDSIREGALGEKNTISYVSCEYRGVDS